MRFCFWWTVALWAVACPLAPAQEASSPSAPAKGSKVCVADIANSSLQPIFADRVKQSLVESLRNQHVNVDNTYTATMVASRLAISGNNKIVFRREKCGFMLLSEVARTAVAANSPADTDHPDSSAAVPLSFHFALFKKGMPSAPVRENSILVPASEDPTSALSAAVERITSEVLLALKSK